MKKTKSLSVVFLVVLFSAVFAFTAFGAKQEYVDGVFTYTVTNGQATIVKCENTNTGVLKIPSTLGGYKVTKLGNDAVGYALTDLTLPSGLEQLGLRNFTKGVTNVHVENIEDWLNIKFDSASASPLFFSENLYVGSELVTDLVIPEGTTVLNDYAFSGCDSIESVTLPKSLTKLGYSAFSFTSVKTLRIDSVEHWCELIANSQKPISPSFRLDASIENFYVGGELLTELVIDEKIKEVPDCAFDEITTIKAVRFEKIDSINLCTTSFVKGNIKEIYVPDLETWFAVCYAFRGGYDGFYIDGELLVDLVIPENIDSLPKGCFAGYKKLESVSFSEPKSMTSSCFIGCGNMKKFYVDSLETWLNSDFGGNYPALYAGGRGLYIDGELVTDLVIPEGITTIPTEAFKGYELLTSVTIPKSVISLGNYAFDCPNLKDVYVESFEAWFNTCALSPNFNHMDTYNPMSFAENLYIGGELVVDLVIPESITEIPTHAFADVDSLESVTFHSGITKVAGNSFGGCDSLKEVYVPDFETWFKVCDAIDKSKLDAIYIGGEKVVDLVIPDNVTKIPNRAFRFYKSLESVSFSSAKYFSVNAFHDCPNLKSIYVDSLETYLKSDFGVVSGETYGLLRPGRMLYVNGEAVTDVVIPESITEVKANAFNGYKALTSVTFPETLTTIGEGAFKYCSSIKSVIFPISVTKVGKDAFYGCGDLEAVYAQKLETWASIKFSNIYANPLYYAGKLYVDGKLVDKIHFTEGKIDIGNRAFAGCEDIVQLIVNEHINSFGRAAFDGCKNLSVYVDSVEQWLTYSFDHKLNNPLYYAKDFYIDGKLVEELVFPENSSIPSRAFAGYGKLKKVTIPASVIIGAECFTESGLDEIVVGSLTEKIEPALTIYSSTFSGTELSKITIGYGVKRIADNAFNGCTEAMCVTDIIIYDGLEEIGGSAFYGCNVKKLVIPSSVKAVGEYAFAECSMLEALTLGDKTEGAAQTVVNHRAFYNCSALKSITLNTGAKRFIGHAFENCKNVEDLYVNDLASYLDIICERTYDWSLTYWSAPAFLADAIYINGESPKNIVIPEGVTRICDYAFYKCKTLETVTFPSTLTYIGEQAFSNCAKLQDVNLPEKLASIEDLAFYGCKSFTKVEFPENVKLVGFGSFEDCSGIEYVVFYEKIGTAGEHAFIGCKNLKQILYTGTESQWMTFVTKNYNSGLANVPYYCEYDPDALFSPKNLSATQTSSSITVKWSAVNGATGYRVFIKNTQTGKWDIAVRTTGKKTTATISNLNSGSKYCVAVKAYMNTGALIMWSPEYSELNTITRPAVTDKVTASQKTESITLKWNKVPGATGYRIYVARNGKWKALKTTTGLTYTATGLNSGTKYTFAVKAYTKHDGNTYWASKYARLETATECKAPAITSVTSASKSKATVKWSDVSGETGYQLYYSTSKNGTYKKINSYAADKLAGSKTFSSSASGKTIYFKVRAYSKVNGQTIFSEWSAVKSVRLK